MSGFLESGRDGMRASKLNPGKMDTLKVGGRVGNLRTATCLKRQLCSLGVLPEPPLLIQFQIAGSRSSDSVDL